MHMKRRGNAEKGLQFDQTIGAMNRFVEMDRRPGLSYRESLIHADLFSFVLATEHRHNFRRATHASETHSMSVLGS